MKPAPCRNPCFSGRWSEGSTSPILPPESWKVVILVLVEDGLKEDNLAREIGEGHDSRNPCFSGRWSEGIYQNALPCGQQP